MLFTNLSLILTYTNQPLQISQISINQINSLSFFEIKLNINHQHFPNILSSPIQKEEVFNNPQFTTIEAFGDNRNRMFIGSIVALSFIFLTNFLLMGFYFYKKAKDSDGSSDHSFSNTLFTNLNCEGQVI